MYLCVCVCECDWRRRKEGLVCVRTDIDSKSHDVRSHAFDVSDFDSEMSLPCQRIRIEETIFVSRNV